MGGASSGVNKHFYLVSLPEIGWTKYNFLHTSQWLLSEKSYFLKEGYKLEVFIYATGGADPKAA